MIRIEEHPLYYFYCSGVRSMNDRSKEDSNHVGFNLLGLPSTLICEANQVGINLLGLPSTVICDLLIRLDLVF